MRIYRKNVIHPKQIEVVNSCYRVSASDYHDAQNILGWDKNIAAMVSGSQDGERMNEYKTHINWARRIMYLAEVYGVCKMDTP